MDPWVVARLDAKALAHFCWPLLAPWVVARLDAKALAHFCWPLLAPWVVARPDAKALAHFCWPLLRAHPLGRPGGDLLSRALRRSTIGPRGLNDRVRNGIGWGPSGIATRSTGRMKRRHQADRQSDHEFC